MLGWSGCRLSWVTQSFQIANYIHVSGHLLLPFTGSDACCIMKGMNGSHVALRLWDTSMREWSFWNQCCFPPSKFYTLVLSFPLTPETFLHPVHFILFFLILPLKEMLWCFDTSQSFMNAVNRLIKVSIYSATRRNKHRVSLSCSPVSLKVFGIKLKKHSFSLVFIICELRTVFFFW